MRDRSFDDYIMRVNIQDLLRDAGYHHNKRDGMRYPTYSRLDGDGRRISGDKFIVTPDGKGCFQPPVYRVFNVISFITEHPHLFAEYNAGMNPYNLVHQVCGRLLNLPKSDIARNILPAQRQHKPFNIANYSIINYQKHNFDTIKLFYPYFKDRKIDIPTQKAFANHILLSTRNGKEKEQYPHRNLAFPLHIPGKEGIVGLEERGRTRLDGTSGYKGKAFGSNSSEGLWIASPKDTPLDKAKDVLWFESAYDAMAYYQLHAQNNKSLDDAVFLSPGGNPTLGQYKGVIRQATNAKHHLCFDADVAGEQFVDNFKKVVRIIKSEMPKVCEDMRDYMASLTDPKNLLSGDADLLPEDLYKAHAKYFDANVEAMSMKNGGVSSEDDIHEQMLKAQDYLNEFRKMLNDKLCIGSEYGRLKTIGIYDIPSWALNAMENGDYEGLSITEQTLLDDFIEEHFPNGYVLCLNPYDESTYNELNFMPAFGTRNPNALPSRGESPFQGVETYRVQFLHPKQRDGVALPNLKVVREVPADGSKDWNDQLILQEEAKANASIGEDSERTVSAGVDIDGDGQLQIDESEEKKQHHSYGR